MQHYYEGHININIFTQNIFLYITNINHSVCPFQPHVVFTTFPGHYTFSIFSSGKTNPPIEQIELGVVGFGVYSNG